MIWKEFVNSCNLTTKSGSSVVRQNIYAVKENRRNGLSEPDWSMQNAHGRRAGSAALGPRAGPVCSLRGEKGKTSSENLVVRIIWLFVQVHLFFCRVKINRLYCTILHTI